MAAKEILTRLEESLLEFYQTRYILSPDVTFCGYGEPTIRWETVCNVAEELRLRHPNIRLRLSTNGLGNVVNQMDITGEVADLFHGVTVALNTADPVQYQTLMMPDLMMRSANAYAFDTARGAHELVVGFIKQCKDKGIKAVEVTAISRPDVDVARVQGLANDLGAQFRLRPYYH